MDKLIAQLSDDLQPVKVLHPPFLRFCMWLGMALAYGALVVAFVGLRPDLAQRLQDPAYVFEFALFFFVGMSAAYNSFLLCLPDMRGQSWALPVPFVFLMAFIIWEACKLVSGAGALHDLHMHLYQCVISALFLFSVPAALLYIMTLRAHATTRPIWQVGMNALSVGALGYVGLRLTCELDDIVHDLFYHILPYLFLGSLAAGIAKRFFKW